ncbi:hypothetical protein M514_02583 [Trichuris suis]|uniref:LisH domain-containing protein n=1 Tax=Trichuris suis TaxID=68888 RepID=A0A085MGY3_9BILA|nr:hypothetical protein M513_02583 [Trichuris suis]KFD71006.1 hypothetical protein M514_02583 [Trichuris suis]KHJ48596.1 hypothetical protein D918_00898 [Trichuris suis]
MTDLSKSEFLEAVSKALEEDGTLNRIRSIMRAEVLRVVSEGKVPQCDVPENRTVSKLRETEAGKLCLSLVCDLFDRYELKCTRSVFASELGLAEDALKTDRQLRTKLSLPEGDDAAVMYLLVTKNLNLNLNTCQAKSTNGERASQTIDSGRSRIGERGKYSIEEVNNERDKPKLASDFPDLGRPRHSVLSDRKQLGDVLESLKILSSGSNTGNSDGTDEEIKEEISAGADGATAQSSNESELHLSF